MTGGRERVRQDDDRVERVGWMVKSYTVTNDDQKRDLSTYLFGPSLVNPASQDERPKQRANAFSINSRLY